MLKKSTLILLVLALSSLAFAQQRSQQQNAKDAPDNFACSFTYSSGPTATFTRYCLSVNGNIVQFDSPSGFEFINAGAVSEGYGICDFTSVPTAYFDYADNDSGNWLPTVVSAPSATARKFVRGTSDGIWQLTQTITQVKASGSGPGSVKIAMALKNLTGINRGVYLIRHADVDAGGTNANDQFSSTDNSAFGLEGLGLGLTNNTFIFDHVGFTQNVYYGPDPCNPFSNMNSNSAPFVGDGSIGHIYAITVPKGASKTVTVTYKPI